MKTATVGFILAVLLALTAGAPFDPVGAIVNLPKSILQIPGNTIKDFTDAISHPVNTAIDIPEKFLNHALADAVTMVLVAPLPPVLQAPVLVFLKICSIIVHAILGAMRTPVATPPTA